MVITKIRNGRSARPDPAGDSVTRDRWQIREDTVGDVMNKSFIPHTDIESLDGVRDGASVGAAKELQEFGADLLVFFHRAGLGINRRLLGRRALWVCVRGCARHFVTRSTTISL